MRHPGPGAANPGPPSPMSTTGWMPVPASSGKLTVLSIAPALAQAVQRIHDGESVSALFDGL